MFTETVLSSLDSGALEDFMVGAVLVSRASHVANMATIFPAPVHRANLDPFDHARGGDCRQPETGKPANSVATAVETAPPSTSILWIRVGHASGPYAPAIAYRNSQGSHARHDRTVALDCKV